MRYVFMRFIIAVFRIPAAACDNVPKKNGIYLVTECHIPLIYQSVCCILITRNNVFFSGIFRWKMLEIISYFSVKYLQSVCAGCQFMKYPAGLRKNSAQMRVIPKDCSTADVRVGSSDGSMEEISWLRQLSTENIYTSGGFYCDSV